MTAAAFSRFVSTTDAKIEINIQNAISKNTIQKAKWAMNLFKHWFNEWEIRLAGPLLKVFMDVQEFTKSDLDYCLKYFYADVRKMDES